MENEQKYRLIVWLIQLLHNEKALNYLETKPIKWTCGDYNIAVFKDVQ